MADRGSRGLLAVIVGLILASGSAVGQVVPPPRPRVFRIQVVDEETGRGVPLVELRTVNQIRYVTDSNGVVAFDEPGLFNLQGLLHRHEPRLRGRQGQFRLPRRRRSQVTEGGSARISIRRRNIAERLYRVTGAGIYRDSILTGDPRPDPRAAAQRPGHGPGQRGQRRLPGEDPLVLGRHQPPRLPARQLPRARGHLGAARPRRARSLEGRGPPLLPRRQGLREADRAHARRWADLDLGPDRAPRPRAARSGCSPTTSRSATCWRSTSRGSPSSIRRRSGSRRSSSSPTRRRIAGDYPSGHAFLHRDRGVDYVYYASPYPLIRVPADPDRLGNPAAFESFTCLKAGHEPRPAAARPRAGGRAPLRLEAEHAGPAPGRAEPADRRRTHQARARRS